MNQQLHDMMMEATKDMPHCYYWPPEYVEKLAMLIVQDCCQALWTNECNMSDLAVEEFNSNSKKIKQHFGFE